MGFILTMRNLNLKSKEQKKKDGESFILTMRNLNITILVVILFALEVLY